MFLTLLDMLRLRSGPQDLPAGWPLAAVLSLIYVTQGLATDRMFGDGQGEPRSLLVISVQFGIIAALLTYRNLSLRIPQTLSALAGTGFIFGLVAILLLSRIDTGQVTPDIAFLYLGLFAWSLLVDAHIYRHALSVKMSRGMMLAVAIFGVNFMLLQSVFG